MNFEYVNGCITEDNFYKILTYNKMVGNLKCFFRQENSSHQSRKFRIN